MLIKKIAETKHNYLDIINVLISCIQAIILTEIRLNVSVVLKKIVLLSGQMVTRIQAGMFTTLIGFLNGFVRNLSKRRNQISKDVCFNLWKKSKIYRMMFM